MKTFGSILLLNIGIYTAYMLILYLFDAEPAAAVPIVIHSIVCFVLSGTIPKSDEGRKRRQAFLISGLLILLIGMPVCFFVGASTVNIN
jgi:4-hydroxybenzoate polyprenyltransferase